MSKHLEEFITFLRFQSVSTLPEHAGDLRACADWLVAKLSGMGLDATLHATARHPIVVARNEHRAGRPTVLIYGHYDVQPADPLAEWHTPPFEPTIRDGVIYARGATDNKGQILAHILGVEQTLKEHGELPVNLTFLIEGEEEVGSGNLEGFLLANRELLKCDIVAVSDSGMLGRGVPTLTYGLRGIAVLEVRLHGPSIDLHSGIYGGTVANPATEIARIVAQLHDADKRVLIPGFYDDVLPLEDWERKAWAGLPFGNEQLQQLTGVSELVGEIDYSGIERVWARPTAEVNGIGGGFQGEGSKTVIPRTAFAKLTFRLVPDQEPADILKKATSYLQSIVPPGIRMEIIPGHAGEPYGNDPLSAWGTAAQRALEEAFPEKPLALIREGGSIPIINTFKRVLGVDTLMLGLALPDANLHAPNENFRLENLDAGIRLNQALLRELAAVQA